MRDFRALVREQLAPLALAPQREHKIVEEWSAQLAEIYDGLRADGLSDDDAWRALQRQLPDWAELGDDLLDAEPVAARLASRSRAPMARRTLRALVTSVREQLTAGLLRDLHAGVRLLTREFGFSATVILTLAICLGANAAIFAVVNAVLLRPLPVPQPEQIVGIGDVYPTITPNDILANDAPSYFDRQEALSSTLDEQAMFTFWYDTLPIDGIPQELRGMRATPSLFRVLRVAPALGRTFTDDEGETGDGRRIILSYSLWQTLYAGDPAVVGKTLRLGWTGEPYTIVGVMPRELSLFDRFDDGHAGRVHGRRSVLDPADLHARAEIRQAAAPAMASSTSGGSGRAPRWNKCRHSSTRSVLATPSGSRSFATTSSGCIPRPRGSRKRSPAVCGERCICSGPAPGSCC